TPYTATVTGHAPAGGVQQVAATLGGHVAVSPSACVPACPTDATMSFALRTDDLSEGRHSLRVAARGENGFVGSARESVSVDRTHPTGPDVIDVDYTGSHVDVSWDQPQDPELRDGSPGSGEVTTEYSYERSDGTWTAYRTSTASSFDISPSEID